MYPPDPDRILFCLWPIGGDNLSCGLPIYWYGLIIVFGMLVGATIGGREAVRRGVDPDHVWGGLTWALILGLIGARLYHVLTPPASMGITAWDYLSMRDIDGNGIADALDFRKGGLGIYGGIFFGLIGVWIYCKRNKLAFLTAADLAGISMPLGQAIGRWGNFFNQELYGSPTTLPWGLRIDAQYRVPPYNDLNNYPVDIARFQPLFLYESLYSLVAAGAIWYVAQRYGKKLLRGELFMLYLGAYAVGRAALDFVRVDNAVVVPGFTYAQLVSILTVLAMIAFTVYRRRRGAAGTPIVGGDRAQGQDQIALLDRELGEGGAAVAVAPAGMMADADEADDEEDGEEDPGEA